MRIEYHLEGGGFWVRPEWNRLLIAWSEMSLDSHVLARDLREA